MKTIKFIQKKRCRLPGLAVLIITAIIAVGINIPRCAGNKTKPQVAENEDKTLSPYFFVKSDDPEQDQLPLKQTSADVNIAGVIADVIVSQVYVNEGKVPLEAIYVFPASTRAAVYAMKMKIGERTLIAKIEEREKARQDYEQAKNDGKSASLLEQQRPNVFQMNVANIMPGDKITVELKYTELLIPEDGIYEFVYPTVVGPRYSETPVLTASTSDKWVANPYLHEGESPPYTFDIAATINSGIPVKNVTCPSHNVNINFDGPSTAILKLDPAEKNGGNRDFIVQYRLTGNQIESGLILYKGKDENFFLAMLQPPKRVSIEQIPPREYVFIVDVSGSMHGYPLDISKKLLRDLIGKLRPVDKFNVILFAGTSSKMAPKSIPATQENITKAIDVIDKQQGGGGTRLLPALKSAFDMAEEEQYSRTIIIATDGYVSVEKEAFDLIRNSLSNANVFAFGIGTGVNRYIIEGMARVGQGEPFVITKQDEASAQAEKFRKYIASPVLTGIKVNYGGFNVYDVEPLTIPDVFAERPVVIYGKWKGTPSGTISLKGTTGSDDYLASIDVGKENPEASNSALRYLWARNRIAMLDDYNNLSVDDERVKEVTNLGLKYNLLTAYTSFVAIDNKVRNKDGEIVSVKQPLPLPEGVSNYAVGGSYGAKGYGGMGGVTRCKKSAEASPAYNYQISTAERSVSEETISSDADGSTMVIAEKMPEFQGGEKKMKEFLEKHIQYPEEEKRKGIHGVVYVSFVVDENGKIIKVKVAKGVSEGLDKEAMRVVKMMPVWIPGERSGKARSMSYVLPVVFKI
ncbi:MAG: TonB family protein [Bacteroidota bacterium]